MAVHGPLYGVREKVSVRCRLKVVTDWKNERQHADSEFQFQMDGAATEIACRAISVLVQGTDAK